MDAPINYNQMPAVGGNAQRKRPAEAPPEDSPAEAPEKVQSTKECQNTSQSSPTTAPPPHSVTTPVSSKTSSRHQHRSQKGSGSDPRKGGSLQKTASCDAEQQTLQSLPQKRSASADRADSIKSPVDSPRREAQKTRKA